MEISQIRKSAEEAFASGMFCAESVLLALAKAQGIESDAFPRVATGFCSGLSRTCGSCGALTGAVMGLGLAFGRSDAQTPALPTYEATQRLIREFEGAFGSRDCKALLDGCDLNTAEGQTMFKERMFRERCFRYTGGAAEIAARIISEHNPTQA